MVSKNDHDCPAQRLKLDWKEEACQQTEQATTLAPLPLQTSVREVRARDPKKRERAK